jgi:hypothetical protein
MSVSDGANETKEEGTPDNDDADGDVVGLIERQKSENHHTTASRFTKKDYKSRRSGRHGARNQTRHKIFCKWLLQRFPQLLHNNTDVTVLDVAGGRGELAARLTMCHQIRVIMVDPRPADVADCFETLVLPKLPNKWQAKLAEHKKENPDFIKETVNSRFTQLTMRFDEQMLETSQELQEAIQDALLLIGMHADGATEAIVDAALRYEKPFCVIPCCVFPKLFPQRMVREDDRQVQVRTHEQFCRYLVERDSRFVMETLPFEGRNVAIWWDGN